MLKSYCQAYVKGVGGEKDCIERKVLASSLLNLQGHFQSAMV